MLPNPLAVVGHRYPAPSDFVHVVMAGFGMAVMIPPVGVRATA
jgi:hypothetical protein